MLEALLKAALEHAPELVIALVVSVVIPFVVKLIRSKTTAEQQKLIGDASNVVYFVVDQIARRTPNQADDKLALGIKLLRDQLIVKTARDEAMARAALMAIHEKQRGPQP